jgi:hypothetical protein
MDLDTYRSEATTAPWTIEVKPHRIIAEIPMRDAVHSLLGRTVLMRGSGKYFDRDVVEKLSEEDWRALNRKVRKIENYLQALSNDAPSGDDVRQVLSQVHHIWNKDDPIGLETREACAKALAVLGVGDVLPVNEAFPGKGGQDNQSPVNSRA